MSYCICRGVHYCKESASASKSWPDMDSTNPDAPQYGLAERNVVDRRSVELGWCASISRTEEFQNQLWTTACIRYQSYQTQSKPNFLIKPHNLLMMWRHFITFNKGLGCRNSEWIISILEKYHSSTVRGFAGPKWAAWGLSCVSRNSHTEWQFCSWLHRLSVFGVCASKIGVSILHHMLLPCMEGSKPMANSEVLVFILAPIKQNPFRTNLIYIRAQSEKRWS